MKTNKQKKKTRQNVDLQQSTRANKDTVLYNRRSISSNFFVFHISRSILSRPSTFLILIVFRTMLSSSTEKYLNLMSCWSWIISPVYLSVISGEFPNGLMNVLSTSEVFFLPWQHLVLISVSFSFYNPYLMTAMLSEISSRIYCFDIKCTKVDRKVYELKRSYDDIINNLLIYFYQWGSSTLTPMEEVCCLQGWLYWKINLIWSYSIRVPWSAY